MKLVIPDHTKDEVFSIQFKGIYLHLYYHFISVHIFINRKFYSPHNQRRVNFSAKVSSVDVAS